MNRRDFLQVCGSLTAHMALTSIFAEGLSVQSAHGAVIPLIDLRKQLSANDALILVPTDADFAKYHVSFNKRTMVTPAVRVMCKTPQAVASTVMWAEQNNIPLAMRSGGHSFEGLSQSSSLVIDTRPMAQMQIAANASSFTVGAGMRLGALYNQLSTRGVAIPAGSCPFVGVTGHTMGGGYGLIARPFGLACDSLTAVELVTADGAIRNVSESNNPDLFWALRGAGGGSYGVVTQLQFRTHKVSKVVTFGVSWSVQIERAIEIMRAWQEWAPKAPREINSIMRVGKDKSGLITMRCFGQTVGSESNLRREVEQITRVQPSKKSFTPMSFINSVNLFAGSDKESDSIYMKGKSDVVKGVMSKDAARLFFTELPAGQLVAMFDAYGGAINDKRDVDTAFAHRENTVCTIQYYSEWDKSEKTAQRLQAMRKFHDTLRPIMSGGAYFNYCDLDIKNYAEAYWGKNLDRLIKIKSEFDSKNLFKHAQSVPLLRPS